MMLYPHNQVYNVILQFHFVLVIFLNLTYTFVSQNGSFSRKLPFSRELLISAAKLQIISENSVQISENRATLTILSINQRTILLNMGIFQYFSVQKSLVVLNIHYTFAAVNQKFEIQMS